MKKIFLAFIVIPLSLIAFTNNAAAQNAMEIDEEHMIDLSPRPLIINIPKNPIAGNHRTGINVRALKNFQKNYPAVTNETWLVAVDRGYVARFNEGATQTIVAYRQNGNLHHTANYYGEDKLPFDVRHIVKSVYYDYSITMVTEVNINDPDTKTIYLVYIRDGINTKIVTICNDEILGVRENLNG